MVARRNKLFSLAIQILNPKQIQSTNVTNTLKSPTFLTFEIRIFDLFRPC